MTITMKVVKTVKDLGENGRRAIKDVKAAGTKMLKATQTLGEAIIGFLVACHLDGVILRQKELVGIAGCNKGYMSRIVSALDQSAEKHKGDYNAAQAECKERGIDRFLLTYKPTKSQRAGARRVLTTGDSDKGQPSEAIEPGTVRTFGELFTMTTNLNAAIEASLPKLKAKERKKLQDAVMQAWHVLEGEEETTDREPAEKREELRAHA